MMDGETVLALFGVVSAYSAEVSIAGVVEGWCANQTTHIIRHHGQCTDVRIASARRSDKVCTSSERVRMARRGAVCVAQSDLFAMGMEGFSEVFKGLYKS